MLFYCLLRAQHNYYKSNAVVQIQSIRVSMNTIQCPSTMQAYINYYRINRALQSLA